MNEAIVDNVARLLSIQIYAKVIATKLVPDWNKDINAYKQACTIIASIVSQYYPQYIEIIRSFLIDIRNVDDDDEIFEICYDYWKRTDGVLDLCP